MTVGREYSVWIRLMRPFLPLKFPKLIAAPSGRDISEAMTVAVSDMIMLRAAMAITSGSSVTMSLIASMNP